MTVSPALAAVLAAATVAQACRLVVPPRRRLEGRLGPYRSLARSRLGTGPADGSVAALVMGPERPIVLRVFWPSIEGVAARLGRLLDTGSHAELSLRLRHAGFVDRDPGQHRMRQLGWTTLGLTVGGSIGVSVLRSATGTALMLIAFGFPGATLARNRLESAIDARRAVMRNEVCTVAQLLAVHLRTGHGPVQAVRSVCRRGGGPVVAEMTDALSWMTGGVAPQEAYERLASDTAEPAAARLYRLLAAAAPGGGDISSSLMAIGADHRSQRRDELARLAVKRRTAMVVPLLLGIAPVMILFVGAPLPSMILSPIR